MKDLCSGMGTPTPPLCRTCSMGSGARACREGSPESLSTGNLPCCTYRPRLCVPHGSAVTCAMRIAQHEENPGGMCCRFQAAHSTGGSVAASRRRPLPLLPAVEGLVRAGASISMAGAKPRTGMSVCGGACDAAEHSSATSKQVEMRRIAMLERGQTG